MSKSINSNELISKIDSLRNEMILKGERKGLSHPETIQCSKELDELIYQFQKVINTN
jgi:stage 0 sporulation regulatory protein